MEIEEESRSKLDHYLVALRFDIRRLSAIVLKFAGGKPEDLRIDDLFLTGASAEEEFKQPEGHGYLMEGEKGDFYRGYGLPGIEPGKTPLDEKWQKINDREKAKWMGMMAAGCRFKYTPPPGERKNVNREQPTGT